MDKSLDRALVWFRRDLRADDHAALYHALRAARQVWCVFVFDRDILDPLPRADRRVEFIRDSLVGAGRRSCARWAARTASTARPDRAPWPAPRRDRRAGARSWTSRRSTPTTTTTRTRWRATPRVRGALADVGVALHTVKDHVVFERGELLTGGGKPYSVFTPYKNAWLKKLDAFYLKAYPVARHAGALARAAGAACARRLPTLADTRLRADQPARAEAARRQRRRRRRCSTTSWQRIDRYDETRDFPAVKGPELPVRAPALRHGVDPPPGARGLAAHAGRATRGAAGLAVAS